MSQISHHVFFVFLGNYLLRRTYHHPCKIMSMLQKKKKKSVEIISYIKDKIIQSPSVTDFFPLLLTISFGLFVACFCMFFCWFVIFLFVEAFVCCTGFFWLFSLTEIPPLLLEDFGFGLWTPLIEDKLIASSDIWEQQVSETWTPSMLSDMS